MEHFSPYEWLLIAAANAFGLDKKVYSERLKWAQNNFNQLELLSDQADDIGLYTAAVLAIRDTDNGIASGFLVGLDSSASGIQMLSTCSRCVTGMTNTGVISDGTRPEIYTKLTHNMGSDVPRSKAKDALMTFFYGSERQPKMAFGEGNMLAKFHAEAKRVAPHAYILRNVLINSWQAFALSHDCVMPDGAHIHKRVWQSKSTKLNLDLLDKRSVTFKHKVNQGTKKGVSLAADLTHGVDGFVVREMQARCNYELGHLEYKYRLLKNHVTGTTTTDRTKFIALGNLENIDQDNIKKYSDSYLVGMLETIERSLDHHSFHMLTVHDEFKCHANNVESMREKYNRIMWELYCSDLIFDMIEQVSGKRYENSLFESSVADKILENSYAIN